MLDWQPVERPEKWHGVGSTLSLADDPGYGCFALAAVGYIESRSRCTVEHGVTVVQPGTDDTARYCLSLSLIHI